MSCSDPGHALCPAVGLGKIWGHCRVKTLQPAVAFAAQKHRKSTLLYEWSSVYACFLQIMPSKNVSNG